MKSLILVFFAFLSLFFISCVSTDKIQSNVDCAIVLINGPSDLTVGETAVLNAVYYDRDNKIIKNCKNITPVWNIGDRNIIEIEKDLGNCIKIKAMKCGDCCVQASVNGLITSLAIQVK
ncbi:MAG: hypothetical protein AB7T10_04035 [bacterium]